MGLKENNLHPVWQQWQATHRWIEIHWKRTVSNCSLFKYNCSKLCTKIILVSTTISTIAILLNWKLII